MSKLSQKKENRADSSQIDYSDYIYIFASTLNQMVNYIPWKKFRFQTAYALTVTGNSEFDNEKWNKQLEITIEKYFKRIEITQEKILSIRDIKDILIKDIGSLNKPIFWNITGGQRPFVLAVSQLVQELGRENDRICYLEGNTNRLIITKTDMAIEITKDYHLEADMNIEIALKLMGFTISNDGQSRTQGFNTLKNHPHRQLFKKIKDKYYKSEDLRKQLILTNKPSSQQSAIVKVKERIKEDLTTEELNVFSERYLENSKTYPFGYILEFMVAFIILDAIENEIADMRISTSLYFTDKAEQRETRGSAIDEFDIVVLTRTGQLLVFECKSGAMDGDIAKSTKYSVYAASGVYGKPILITPFKQDEMIDSNRSTNKDDIFNNIKSAIRSAKRATLTVWGIDEISSKIKDKIK